MNSRSFSNLTPSKGLPHPILPVTPIPWLHALPHSAHTIHHHLLLALHSKHIQNPTVSYHLHIYLLGSEPHHVISKPEFLQQPDTQMPLCSSQFSKPEILFTKLIWSHYFSALSGSWFYLDKISVNGLWALHLCTLPPITPPHPEFFLSNLCSDTASWFGLTQAGPSSYSNSPHSHLLLLPLCMATSLFSF